MVCFGWLCGGKEEMASMTTEFYKVVLVTRAKEEEVDYKKIKDIVTEIILEHSVYNDGYQSIDLSPDILPTSIEPKEIMDIFDDDKYLFGRITRKKANNTVIKRDYNTLKADNVFEEDEAEDKGIEVYTFFILDYDQGILSVVNTKGAPNFKALDALCLNYSPEYKLNFESIPNENGIAVLYGAATPSVSKFEFEIPTPNAEFLQAVLGLDEDIIREMIENSVYSSVITLKAMPYHQLLSQKEKVKEVLDILIRKKRNYSKAIIRGKAENFGSRNFDLHAKYFTYPIEVRKFHTVRGKQVEYSLQELVEQFKHGLHMAYESNFDIINAIANR